MLVIFVSQLCKSFYINFIFHSRAEKSLTAIKTKEKETTESVVDVDDDSEDELVYQPLFAAVADAVNAQANADISVMSVAHDLLSGGKVNKMFNCKYRRFKNLMLSIIMQLQREEVHKKMVKAFIKQEMKNRYVADSSTGENFGKDRLKLGSVESFPKSFEKYRQLNSTADLEKLKENFHRDYRGKIFKILS